MNTRLSLLALALMGSTAMAASATVWSVANSKDVKGEIPPYGWYTYTYPEKNTAVTVESSMLATAKLVSVTVSKTVESSAGVGFSWAKNDASIDLSAYSGVCLTYSATAPFRLDFKQPNIDDSNYNGFDVPKKGSVDTLFIPFADLAQEDWGDATVEVAFDPKKQTGVQFSYKKSFVATSGTSNTIRLSSITLGTSCSNHAPTLKSGVKAADTADLLEGDTVKVDLSTIFEDADGDNLNVIITKDGKWAKNLTGKDTVSLATTVLLGSEPNPEEGATTTFTFTAFDAKGLSAEYSITLSLEDRENLPVAVDDYYEVYEDSVLKVTAAKGVMANDYDPDGDDFMALQATPASHGTVLFNGSGFTYTPDPDFHGEDSFTYVLRTGEDGMDGNVATVTIKVINVDDPATVQVLDSTMHIESATGPAYNMAGGLALDEDFDPIDIFIPMANVVFADPDFEGSTFPVNARSLKGFMNVEYSKIGTNHVVSLLPVADANGTDILQLYAVDGKDTVSLDITIVVLPVADPPKAVNDTISVGEDSRTSITAAKGVLANDYNPDGKSALKAYLLTEPEQGTVVLDTTGAFTYEVGAFEGEDTFTYFVVNAEGDTSLPATVYLTVEYKNKAPVIVAGVEDTVGTRVAALREDFGASYVFKSAEVKSWFTDPEKDAITFTASSPDSLLNVTINSAFTITVKSVKDACGEAVIAVTATDAQKNSTTLNIPASIECVNDAPVRVGNPIDTILVTPAGWRTAYGVFDLFSDPDDTTLTMKTTQVDKILDAKVEGDSLIVKLADELQYLQDKVPYTMKVSAVDAAGSTSVPKSLVFMVGDKTSIPQVFAAPKASWQNAILADRGVAAMFDMQGRMIWKHRLPVSEAQVRNAAAKVQGRKILQVNKQTWTIK